MPYTWVTGLGRVVPEGLDVARVRRLHFSTGKIPVNRLHKERTASPRNPRQCDILQGSFLQLLAFPRFSALGVSAEIERT